MAHELSFRQDGTAEAYFALSAAWHGLGTVLDHVATSEEARDVAGLNWQVETRPVYCNYDDDNVLPAPEHMATIRSDNKRVLGVVGTGYQVVQNQQIFDFLDSLLQDGAMKYESAGALRGGAIVWALARMPGFDEIAPGDAVNRYILFSTAHDGSRRLNAIPTSTRVVCMNTLRVATARDVGIRHSGDMAGKLDQARKFLSQFDPAFTLFRDEARTLATKGYTPEQAKAYVNQLFPEVKELGRSRSIRDNKVQDVRDALRSSRQQIGSIKGTWWALFNAVSESIDHDSRRDYSKPQAREQRFLRVMEGTGADFKHDAFKLALTMAG